MIKTDALIVGAGPAGIFCVHQLGIIGLKCEVVDNLDKIGGQCIELYPDKPIYDIPALTKCTGEELTNNLIEQIKPFKTNFHLNERVEEIKKDKKIFKNKTISIFGGGDSALDWAIELSNTSKVILVHRRDDFRGAQTSIDKIHKLKKEGKIEIYTKYQLKSVTGKNNIENIIIKHENENESEKEIKTDYVLGFCGLIMKLGPITEWGLNIDKKHIPVNTENFETNQKGIFAIGDICTYPGKLKLILSGFHEGALAARGCFKYARPDEKLRFEFSTTSKATHERLGIKK